MDRSKQRSQILDPERPFDFSQASLQDYQDCRRRFQLRYLEQLRWPAAQTEPIRENEAALRRGERFHRLAQQDLLGIPLDKLNRITQADPDPALSGWWDSFTRFLSTLPDGERQVETLLAAPLGRHRLLAKYDLILFTSQGERVIIYDWKTTPHKPKRAWLERRLQTLVYPYLLARTASTLNGGRGIRPDQIEMIYWFASEPERPERFVYTADRFKRAGMELLALVEEIAALKAENFERTEDEKSCRFCVYRSLCDRGVSAGLYAEMEEDPESGAEIEINFDQIGEISF